MDAKICPKCSQGNMVPRSGPYGPFSACSRFPACDYKEKSPNKSQLRGRAQGLR
ncbi:topoisomerase DNA-binding C4 zinc finger domain-containing protein [Variovorax davisae]|uniref:topoisomerase DNA-binding C4 zinc finger domain-containing protein n=1 Tax=Variovorax davisae TaxID=3053515 RepID=UPI0033659EF4